MTDDTKANLDITLFASPTTSYQITAIGPSGEATGVFHRMMSDSEISFQMNQIWVMPFFGNRPANTKASLFSAQSFGQLLFERVFVGPVLELYRRSQSILGDTGLKLRLNIESPNLTALPWELLYDQQAAKFLALSRSSVILRYLPGRDTFSERLGISLPLRMLVLLASPQGTPSVDLDQQLAELEQATAALCSAGLLEITVLRGPESFLRLQHSLRTSYYHLLHFIGHAWQDPSQNESGLIGENANGATELISAANLALLLNDQRSLRFAYIDAAENKPFDGISASNTAAATLVRNGMSAALSWRHPFGNVSRIAFLRTFYETLAEGGPLDLAITEARKALAVQTSSPAWAAASLYTRLSDQRLFTIVSPAPSTTGRTRDDERQRRAAEAARDAQVEQDARRLEAVASVTEIAQAARGLGGGDLDSPASSVLRSFGRIGQDVGAALQQGSSYNQRTALTVIEDRLDVLYRELAASPLPYAGRFQPIADHWRAIIGEHIRALADEVEQLQEIDSPYIAGPPLTEQQDTFTGRTGASQRIEQLVLDRRSPPLLLYGQRRMGKTSLLRNLGRLLPSTIVPMFVDLQGPPANASDHAGLLYNLARAMADSAQRYRQIELLRLTREALATDPFTVFDEWLDDVERVLGRNATSGRTALLMLDEFEALEKPFGAGRFDETQVLGTLRNLIQHRPRFRVLLAGTHTFDEYARWASYLINVQLIHLSYLGEKETRDLIERPMTDFALRYEPAAVDRIIALTRGHPYLAQLLCSEIVALKNQQEVAMRRLARLADVEQAVPQALDSGAMFFADLAANQVDAAGRALLTALAAAGEGQASPLAALAPALPDPADAAQVAERLRRRELIEPAGTGFRFQVELIRRWFARA